MITSRGLVGLFPLFLHLSFTTVMAQNLVQNPSFEIVNASAGSNGLPEHWNVRFFEFPASWIPANDNFSYASGIELRDDATANNTDRSQDGTKHIAMWDCVEFWQDEILVQPGGEYQLSYWAYHNQSAVADPFIDYIHSVSWAGGNPNPIIHTGDSGWQQITMNAILNTTQTRIFFYWVQKAAEFRLDNVSLTLVNPPSPNKEVPVNLVTNGGFEDSAIEPGAAWNCDALCGIYEPSSAHYPPEGLNQLYMQSFNNPATLKQHLTIDSNSTYDISFLAHNTGVDGDADLEVFLGTESQIFRIPSGAEYTGPWTRFTTSLPIAADSNNTDLAFTFRTPNAFLRLDDVRVYKSDKPVTPPLNPIDNNLSKKSSNAGPIAGGVIGGLTAVALIVAGAFFYRKYQRKQELQRRRMEASIMAQEFEKFATGNDGSTVAGSPSPFPSVTEHVSNTPYGATRSDTSSVPRFNMVPELQTTSPRPPTGMSVSNPHFPDTYSQWDHTPQSFTSAAISGTNYDQTQPDSYSHWAHGAR
ncbi:hypothetical protein BT69DRAFT_1316849 [Atractiella rhizophila]|nr:hypothetical protein BT69DRAFT_1316849 [Atractiella rhizophila]